MEFLNIKFDTPELKRLFIESVVKYLDGDIIESMMDDSQTLDWDEDRIIFNYDESVDEFTVSVEPVEAGED